MLRKLLTIFLGNLITLNVCAQTTAQNFTKTDCNNVTHTLFNYLDAGKVVVIEFGMGCSTCITAAQNLTTVNSYYNTTNPGKVIFLYMDYQVNNCVQVGNFINLNNINFPGIASCQAEKAYYFNTSPMPGVIVAGGGAHTVYFNDSDYVAIDSIALMNAINNAIADPASVNNAELQNSILIYPNPTNGYVGIANKSGNEITDILITNTLGEIMSVNLNINNSGLYTGYLPQGIYTVSVFINGFRINKKLIVF